MKIGISSCLLGNLVRYDGGHKLDQYLAETLAQYVDYVSVCPEVECGLGVPREPMHLVGDPLSPRLVTVRTQRDHTDRMIQWVKKRVKKLEKEDLCGFIFKSNSPSSGMERVKVQTSAGRRLVRKGVGIFAKAFMDHFPMIPTEDERRLRDQNTRENFIVRIHVMRSWRESSRGRKLRNLVSFHTSHEPIIRSHSQDHWCEMERLVSGAKSIPRSDLFSRYAKLLKEALELKTTTSRNRRLHT
jgi:uncharacterized protein YbbK (DUF523 family)